MSPVSLSAEAWRRLAEAAAAAARSPGEEERSALFRALVPAADRPLPVARDHPVAPLFAALEHQVRAWCCTTPALRAKLTPGLATLAAECLAAMDPPPPPVAAAIGECFRRPRAEVDALRDAAEAGEAFARRLPYRDDTFDPDPAEQETGT